MRAEFTKPFDPKDNAGSPVVATDAASHLRAAERHTLDTSERLLGVVDRDGSARSAGCAARLVAGGDGGAVLQERERLALAILRLGGGGAVGAVGGQLDDGDLVGGVHVDDLVVDADC